MEIPAKLASANCIAVFVYCLFYLVIHLCVVVFIVCLTGPLRWLC